MVAPEDDGAPGIADRAKLLRYRITCCRDSLRTGVPAAMAVWLVIEIQRAEAELVLLNEGPAAEENDGERSGEE